VTGFFQAFEMHLLFSNKCDTIIRKYTKHDGRHAMKIFTVTLSPAYDVHAQADSLTVGKENLIYSPLRSIGGKGINISAALLAYGVESLAIILAGEDNKDELKEGLRANGIDSKIIKTRGRIRENLTIHTPTGETRISYKPEPCDGAALERVIAAIDAKCGDVVTLTGRVPDGIDISRLTDFLSELTVRGVRTVIDSRSLSLSDIIKARPWLIKPNQEEISVYLEREIRNFDDCREAACELSNRGIENVMISMGEGGAMLACSGKVISANAPSVDVRSTVGAGDSAIAGFISAILDGENKSEALRRAVAFGTAACLTDATAPPSREAIDKLTKKIRIQN